MSLLTSWRDRQGIAEDEIAIGYLYWPPPYHQAACLAYGTVSTGSPTKRSAQLVASHVGCAFYLEARQSIVIAAQYKVWDVALAETGAFLARGTANIGKGFASSREDAVSRHARFAIRARPPASAAVLYVGCLVHTDTIAQLIGSGAVTRRPARRRGPAARRTARLAVAAEFTSAIRRTRTKGRTHTPRQRSNWIILLEQSPRGSTDRDSEETEICA